MSNFLVTQALDTIWCAPGQDKQFNFLLNRVSPNRGFRDTFDIESLKIPLPKSKGTFHVFNIGQINPRLLGLLPSLRQWTRADFIINKESINFVMMNDRGIVFPRHRCYYQLTRNNNLLFAVEEVPWMVPYIAEERIYFHCYTNALKYSDRNVMGALISCKSASVTNRTEIIAFQNEAAEPVPYGRRFCFVNGHYVSAITLSNVNAGDDVEWVIDQSVRQTLTYHIPTLPRFDSELDSLMKYLITYPNNNTTVDYHDDIELFAYVKDANDRFKGTYLHRNDCRTLRNLTHADYSLSVQAVGNLLQSNGVTNHENAYVEVNIRNGGLNHPVTQNQSRVYDLYRLDYTKRVRAMVGVDATVSVWRAAALEKSAYVALQRYPTMQLPVATVEDNYASHASGKLVANTPQRVTNITGAPGAVLGYILGKRSTVFEYDENGVFLEQYLHDVGERYFTRRPLARYLETFKGYGSISTSDVYNTDTVPLKPGYNYRCYRRSRGNGLIPAGPWQDVTGSSFYTVTNNAVHWVTDSRVETLVRFNDTFLFYTTTATRYKGNLHFTIMEQVYKDQLQITQPMDLPRGDLDVFLNGHSLVEGIDYVLQFPEIIIISKRHVLQPGDTRAQTVSVRYRDFCDSDCKPRRRAETGFVSHGLLSHDKHVQLRRDRVVRATVDGKLRLPDQYTFPDESSGTVGVNPINGKPFSLRDEVIPLNEVMVKDTYDTLALSRAIDTEVSNYLTRYLPSNTPSGPNVIDGLYPLCSPFIQAIYNDLAKGVLVVPYIHEHYNDERVIDTLKPYEFLLAFDPTQHGSYVSKVYTDVHPVLINTVTAIPIHMYEFLDRACRIYTAHRVVLNHYFSVTSIPEV